MLLTSNEVRKIIEGVLGEHLADDELVVELAADVVIALEQEGVWDGDGSSDEEEGELEHGMSIRKF